MHRSFQPPRSAVRAAVADSPFATPRLLAWAGMFFILALLVLSGSFAHATTYYMSTTGNDANAGTTTSTPWKTITHALPSLRGGDVVIYADGTYTESIDLSLIPLASTPVTLKAQNSRAATINGGGAFFAIGSSVHVNGAVKVQGFKITNGAMGIGFDRTGDNIEFDDCEVWGCIEGFRLRGGSNLKLADIYLHNNQYGFLIGVMDVSGITGVTIDRCIAADNAEAGQTGNTDGFMIEIPSTNVVVRDCVSHGHGDSGFDIKPAGSRVERCLSYNNNGMGFKLWSSNDTIVNCISYGNKIEGMATGGDNLQIWGCTIANNGAHGIRFEGANPSTSTVRNCILYNNPAWMLQAGMYSDDYNCYYSSSGQSVIQTTSASYTGAQVQAHTAPVGAHSIGKDPLFVAPGTADFRLSASSPCIGAGVANTLVALDYYAKTRKSPPDMGAIETNSGGTPVVPTAPTSVTVVPSPTADAGQDLAAQAAGSTTSNGATITYKYQWCVSTDGGATWGTWGYDGQSLPKANLANGQQWKARACATADGTNDSPSTVSAVTTIQATTGTTAPTAPTSCVITPGPTVPVISDMRATATGSTSATGGTITYAYQWAVSTDSGATWTAWGFDGAVLSHTNLMVGQTWRARACATTDGTNYSPWTVSANVTVVASLGQPTSVTISPSAPTAGQALTASALPATLPAGYTYQFQWRRSTDGGATWSKWGWTGATLAGSNVVAGQKWQAHGRTLYHTSKKTTYSPWVDSQIVTVGSGSTGQNQAPTAPTSVTISPSAPHDSDTLVPQATGSTDPQGTAVTYQYRWYYSQDGGLSWNQYSVVASLDSGLTGVGEQWKVEARAYDGSLYSGWTMSAPVTIAP